MELHVKSPLGFEKNYRSESVSWDLTIYICVGGWVSEGRAGGGGWMGGNGFYFNSCIFDVSKLQLISQIKIVFSVC